MDRNWQPETRVVPARSRHNETRSHGARILPYHVHPPSKPLACDRYPIAGGRDAKEAIGAATSGDERIADRGPAGAVMASGQATAIVGIGRTGQRHVIPAEAVVQRPAVLAGV